MNNNAWFKKENPFQTVIGFGGGATGFGAYSSSATKTYVDEVFSTYVYEGNQSARNITNTVDLTKGGLTWIKNRSGEANHALFDTVRGATKEIISDSNAAETTQSTSLTAFNSNGFSLGADAGNRYNQNSTDYSSWSFRKARGFFDVVQYTGNGSARTISHGLGSIPGLIMIKGTSSVNSWYVYHREVGETKYLMLNNTNGSATQSWFMNDTAPTSSVFSLGTSANVNGSGETYVAYLFAGGESTASEAVSVDFDGSNDGLSASSSDLVLGTGDFTVECWFKYDAGNTDRIISMDKTSNPTNKWLIYHHNGSVRLNINGSDVIFMGADNGFDTNNTDKWYHLALVKSSNSIKLYLNGLADPTTVSDSLDYQSDEIHIGMNPSGTENFDGLISNVRVVAGTAVYTSSFIPPTEPLTNITNTKILCCNNSSVTGKTVGPTITATDSPTASTNSPFDDPEGFKFGEGGDQNIIKCGSYIGNGASDGPEVYVGFEPQWLLIRGAGGGDWNIVDNMRGIVSGGNDNRLWANLTGAESTSLDVVDITSTGFKIKHDGSSFNGTGSGGMLYMAIRRPDGYVGKLPSAGTDVFAMDTGSNNFPAFDSNFPVDFVLQKAPDSTANWLVPSRLTGSANYLKTNLNSAEASWSVFDMDSNVGWGAASTWASATNDAWMFKRGKGFDVVTWEGTNGNVERRHNLGTTPEMIWFKNRDATRNWRTYHKGLNGGTNPEDYEISLNASSAEGANTSYMNGTAPTSTTFVAGNDDDTNGAGYSYIALLFASANDAEGNPISKVGSYDGTGSEFTVTTGFQPRFVIIKPYNNTRGWTVLDTQRGWGAGVDNKIYLNDSGAQVNTWNYGEPTSTGFKVSPDPQYDINYTGWKYIYYAHA